MDYTGPATRDGDEGGLAQSAVAPARAPTTPQLVAAGIPVLISPGEALDRLTILTLKAAATLSPEQARRIALERQLLARSWRETLGTEPTETSEWQELLEINRRLWDLEDAVRSCELAREFGAEFIDRARSIYRVNNLRASLKQTLNERLGSALCDFKFHPNEAATDSP